MPPRPRKNGSGDATIVTEDRGGWLRVFAQSPEDVSNDELPFHLSDGLQKWRQANPDRRLLATFGVVQAGEMVAIHAFYERVVLS